MTQDSFHRFLDNQENVPKENEARELVLLLQEVSELDKDEDPGQAYWNQFNHRLQNRLDRVGKPRRFRGVRPWLVFAGMAAVLMAAFLWPNRQDPQSEKTLASLDMEHLSIIGEMYSEPFLDESNYELADQDLDLLLEVTNPLFDDPYSNLDQLDFETWNTEDREG